MPAHLPQVTLAGLDLHAVTQSTAVDHITAMSAAGVGGLVVTPNVDHLRLLREDRRLGVAYEAADMVLADGMPLIWASRIIGTPLPERVAGSELIVPLTRAADQRRRSVAIIGGQEGSAWATAARLREQMPALRIVHVSCPTIPTDEIDEHAVRIAAALRDAGADIVFVGLGAPKQELLCDALRQRLPAVWFLGVGAGLDMVAGRARKAPRWIAALGMEWVFRLLQEPARLGRRYLCKDVPVALQLLVGSAWRRARSARRSTASP